MENNQDDYRRNVDTIRTRRDSAAARNKTRGPGDSTHAGNVPDGISPHGAAIRHDGNVPQYDGVNDNGGIGAAEISGGIAGRSTNQSGQATNNPGRSGRESGDVNTTPSPTRQQLRDTPAARAAIARERERLEKLQAQYRAYGIDADTLPESAGSDPADLPEPPPVERIPPGGYRKGKPRIDGVTGRVGGVAGTTASTTSATAETSIKDNILRFPFRLGGKAKTVTAPLSEDEAKRYREDTINALEVCCKLADTIITHTNRKHTPAYIWQELERKELSSIADILIRTGKKNPATAKFVRAMVQNYDKWELGMITGSRFMATVQHYADNGGVYLGFIIPGPAVRHRN